MKMLTDEVRARLEKNGWDSWDVFDIEGAKEVAKELRQLGHSTKILKLDLDCDCGDLFEVYYR